jgi:polyphosphate kinase
MANKTNRFVNRELSWLEFNQRVLDEAACVDVPLMDRLFFLTITASNLDEFFMVRVGGLELLREAGVRKRDPANMTPVQQLTQIAERVRRMVTDQYALYHDVVLPELAAAGLVLAHVDTMTADERGQVRTTFADELLPVLTPMSLDPSGPVPLLQNLDLYVAVQLSPSKNSKFPADYAVVPVGRNLARLWPITGKASGHAFVLIEDLVITHIADLFPGRQVLSAAPFRITRNADMIVEEEFASDLSLEMETVLQQRRTSGCVRLEVDHKASRPLITFLRELLRVPKAGVVQVNGPVDLTGLRALAALEGYADLHSPSWPAQPAADIDPKASLFEQIERRDILLSFPFESFDPIVRFVSEAADDPDVLAIKQILYRTSPDSPIIQALRRAAENGKYVTVIVELKARFDEARNIAWARELESAGVQVIYGVKYLKTHGKICMVVRREREGVVRYVHFGTGNYDEKTACLYTDVGLLTRDPELGADASSFFNAISGRSEPRPYRWLEQSPLRLRDRLLELIADEAARAKQGHRGRIMAKMNSLVDPALINALYKASKAGVEILLNVRGICCLRPGVKGLSENIHVVSIVDRFLEHSRIVSFHHGGAKLTFISSADWMPRNLDRRVELLVPVRDKACKRKLLSILKICFNDNVKARTILPDGGYAPVSNKKQRSAVRCQDVLFQDAREARKQAERDRLTSFEPHLPPTQ